MRDFYVYGFKSRDDYVTFSIRAEMRPTTRHFSGMGLLLLTQTQLSAKE